MGRRIHQERFAPAAFLGDENFNVHVSAASHRETVVVLVHGLGGDGYGTWGGMLEYIFDEMNLDVALFKYRSAHKRLIRIGQVSFSDIEEELGQELAHLDYENIVLIGHSMGGLVIEACIQRLHTYRGNSYEHLRRVRGLVLLASPRLGSVAVPNWVRTRDANYLRAFDDRLQQVQLYFATHLDRRINSAEPNQWPMPTYAAAADNDLWVKKASAFASIPEGQTQTFPGSHTSFFKTIDPEGRYANWLKMSIGTLLSAQRRRQISSTEVIVSRFHGDPTRGSWEDTYLNALEAVRRDLEVALVDSRVSPGRVDVSVRVVSDHAVNERTVSDLVSLELSEVRLSPDRWLGISPYGVDSAGAVTVLRAAIGPVASVWIQESESDDELRSCIYSWLARVCRTKQMTSSSRFSSRSLRNEDLLEQEMHIFRLSRDMEA